LIKVKDSSGNSYFSKKDISGESKFSFTTHSFSDYSTCFTNVLESGSPSTETYSVIEIDMDLTSEHLNTRTAVESQKLKPIELELRNLETVLEYMTVEMTGLRERESQMRNTNESTNSRVKWFNLFSISVLICSGVWQVFYLKKFFKSKKII
jgi:hypothetical protein